MGLTYRKNLGRPLTSDEIDANFEFFTSSLNGATTGSNTFVGNQTITGSIFISGSIIPAVGTGELTSSFNLGSENAAWKEIFVSEGSIRFIKSGSSPVVLSAKDGGIQINSGSVISADGVSGQFSTPKSLSDNVTVKDSSNSLLMGPIEVETDKEISVEDGSDLTIFGDIDTTTPDNLSISTLTATNNISTSGKVNSSFFTNKKTINSNITVNSNENALIIGETNIEEDKEISIEDDSELTIFGDIETPTTVDSASFATTAVTSFYPLSVVNTNDYYGGALYTTAPQVASGVPSGRSASGSIWLGKDAGLNATDAINSIFIGPYAGNFAFSGSSTVAIGITAGFSASYANLSTFVGIGAGNRMWSGSDSTAIGVATGQYAHNANKSVFIGNFAGAYAKNAVKSIVIGYQAGYDLNAGSNSIGSNNIVIGSYLTLPSGSQDSINIGGIIFGTGSYSTETVSTGSLTGKIGINVVSPNYTLDVSGSGNYSEGLTVTGSLAVTGSLTVTELLNVTPLTSAPSSPGVEGQIVPVMDTSNSLYYIYVYLNGDWRSVSLS